MDEAKQPSLATQLRRIGVNKSHAYMIAWKKRAPSLPLALRIHRELGLKLGPLADATDEQIAVLSDMTSEAAA